MTRKKKTRSLSRIHKVKTGSISKLKREAGNDRQSSKRIKGRQQKSAYEKYLTKNPDAKQKAVQDQQQAQKSAENKDHIHNKDKKPEKKQIKDKGLLDQLESKDFNDIY